MSKEKTACFTGHRAVSRLLSEDKLIELICFMYEKKGVDTFIAGGAIGFDMLASNAVLYVKREIHPEIKLYIYAPCNNQSERWNTSDKLAYDILLSSADKVDMEDKPYYDGCMQRRNYKMVDDSSFCICYYKRERSGTGQTVRYAERNGLGIINVAELEGK